MIQHLFFKQFLPAFLQIPIYSYKSAVTQPGRICLNNFNRLLIPVSSDIFTTLLPSLLKGTIRDLNHIQYQLFFRFQNIFFYRVVKVVKVSHALPGTYMILKQTFYIILLSSLPVCNSLNLSTILSTSSAS